MQHGVMDTKDVRCSPPINGVVARILHSPVSGLVDGALLLLRIRGRHSGREMAFPVQYAVGKDAVWALPGDRNGRPGGET